MRASAANIAAFEAQKAQLEARNLESKAEAEALAAKLDGQQFIVIRSASDAGALYGSVTTRDAAEAATEAGFSLDKKQVAGPGGQDRGHAVPAAGRRVRSFRVDLREGTSPDPISRRDAQIPPHRAQPPPPIELPNAFSPSLTHLTSVHPKTG